MNGQENNSFRILILYFYIAKNLYCGFIDAAALFVLQLKFAIRLAYYV